MPARPTRRAVLGAALAAAACTPRRGRTTRTDPDAVLLAEARAQELALVAAYDGLLATVTAPLRPMIQQLRDAHAAHVVALGASATPVPSASATTGPPPPGEPAAALVPVTVAEATAQRAHRLRARRAAAGETAALLASVAAADGAYATTLRMVSAR